MGNTAADARFEFGRNWEHFLRVLDEERVMAAEKSLCGMLQMENLDGKSFLDIGCGSGLSSLAAMRRGCARTHSFDYDTHSVACTLELKRRHFPDATNWIIERGDVMNREYLTSLGRFDIVYAWGSLHHTGALWRALENSVACVAPGGVLMVAIYNDQGWLSRFWTLEKKLYNRGAAWRSVMCGLFLPGFVAAGFAADISKGKNPVRRYREYKNGRGMSYLHDVVDWIGGYPFEVASRERVIEFLGAQGLTLRNLRSCGRKLGCNEFVMTNRGG